MKERIQVTRRQHYVFRKYLKAWADTKKSDPQLCAMNKNSKGIFRSGLMGVAQQYYFYEFKVLTEVEKMMVVILSTSPYETLNNFDPYFTLREVEIINLKERVETAKSTSQYTPQHFIDERRQLGETKQSRYENVGQRFIELLLSENVNFYSIDKDRIDFIFFLMMQYVRTKAIRESLNSAFSNVHEDLERLKRSVDLVSALAIKNNIPFDKEKAEEELEDLNANLNFDKVTPFITYSTVDELTYAFAYMQKMNLNIIKAHPDIKFITGDQPVINIHAPSRNSHEEIDNLEFYYPLSPMIAIVLNFKDHDPWPEKISKEQTLELNNKIFEAAHLQVYAGDESDFRSGGII